MRLVNRFCVRVTVCYRDVRKRENRNRDRNSYKPLGKRPAHSVFSVRNIGRYPCGCQENGWRNTAEKAGFGRALERLGLGHLDTPQKAGRVFSKGRDSRRKRLVGSLCLDVEAFMTGEHTRSPKSMHLKLGTRKEIINPGGPGHFSFFFPSRLAVVTEFASISLSKQHLQAVAVSIRSSLSQLERLLDVPSMPSRNREYCAHRFHARANFPAAQAEQPARSQTAFGGVGFRSVTLAWCRGFPILTMVSIAPRYPFASSAKYGTAGTP
jgi:hypothetical protein